MNTKVIMLLIVLVVLVGAGALLLSVNRTTQTQQSSQPTPTSQTQQTTPQEEMQETPTTITVTKDGFSPQTVTVKPGTRVIWVNESGNTVTVNSAVHPTHLVYPPLNLGEFANGSSVQLVFDRAGEYKYHNHLVPSQTGVVVVE